MCHECMAGLSSPLGSCDSLLDDAENLALAVTAAAVSLWLESPDALAVAVSSMQQTDFTLDGIQSGTCAYKLPGTKHCWTCGPMIMWKSRCTASES